jgi:GNAT superfamily N-acetyltransferase
MTVNDVESNDADDLLLLMFRVIETSLQVEDQEKRLVAENVRDNLTWALAHPGECVHLKAVQRGLTVGVILIKDFWNLSSLFVDPENQRTGVGRALVNEGIRRCAARGRMGYVRVNSSPNAIKFYLSMAFRHMPDSPRRGASTPLILTLGDDVN